MVSAQNMLLLLFASLAFSQLANANAIAYGRQFGWMGGHNGGYAVDDGIGATADERLIKLCMRSGARVGQVTFTTTNRTLVHGRSGRSEQCWIEPEIVAYNVCWGSVRGSDRVFRVAFETADGMILGGGTETKSCGRYILPTGVKVVGMVGRSARAIDTFGLSFYVKSV